MDRISEGSVLHRDGWGVAFYRDGTAIIIKEPTPAKDSDMAKILSGTDYIRSNMAVSHIRLKTNGERSYANPFKRELYGKE